MPQQQQFREGGDYYGLVKRQSLSDFAPANVPFAVPPGFFATQITHVNVPQVNFQLNAGQALRLVSADALIFDNASTGSIVVLNADLEVFTRGGNVTARSYGARYGGQIVLASGLMVHAQDEEWYFWDDYAEQGGSVGAFLIGFFCDLHNTSAAPVNVSAELTVIVEFYEKQRLPLKAITRESELAAQGVSPNLLR